MKSPLRTFFPIALCALLAQGCAQTSHTKVVGFPGKPQDRIKPGSGNYDIREQVDDSPDFREGNFQPGMDDLLPEEEF